MKCGAEEWFGDSRVPGSSRSGRVSAPSKDTNICVATSQVNDEIPNGGGIDVALRKDKASQYR